MNKFMKIALDEAEKAFCEGNVPVGAVIIKNNNVLSINHNKKNSNNVSVYHAELLCIIDACKQLNSWYLDDCIMYVTLKPCKMCEAAIAESRIREVIYLLDSNYSKNLDINISNIKYSKIDDNTDYINMLSDFFKVVRNSDVSRETSE